MIPWDFVSLAHTLNDYLARQRPAKSAEERDKHQIRALQHSLGVRF